MNKPFAIGACIVAVLCLWIAATPLSGQTIESTRRDGYAVITGTIDANGWYPEARAVLLDFDGYAAWATRYMDGNDPASSDDWALFTRFEFEPPDSMILHYDMNMTWPLNRKNNHADFTVTVENDTIVFDVDRAPFGLNDVRMVLDLSHRPVIEFRIEIRFWWIVDKLIDHREFELYLADRVIKMQQNMRDRVRGEL